MVVVDEALEEVGDGGRDGEREGGQDDGWIEVNAKVSFLVKDPLLK